MAKPPSHPTLSPGGGEGKGGFARLSDALQLVLLDGKCADALAGQRVDRVADRWGHGGDARLSEAAGGRAGVEDVGFHNGRLVDSQHRIVVEVRLLHAPAVDGDGTVEESSEGVDSAAF